MYVTLIDAWQRLEPRHAADAQWWWRLQGVSGDERQERQGDICALLYVGNSFAGVATARVEDVPQVRARMAVYYCEIIPDFRGRGLAWRLTGFAHAGLARWSARHPGERVMGLAVVVRPRDGRRLWRTPVWGDCGLDFNLAGYTGSDEQIRVAWFRHARLDRPPA